MYTSADCDGLCSGDYLSEWVLIAEQVHAAQIALLCPADIALLVIMRYLKAADWLYVNRSYTRSTVVLDTSSTSPGGPCSAERFASSPGYWVHALPHPRAELLCPV